MPSAPQNSTQSGSDSLSQHLHFVTGKGGVGKSTFSAALAMKLANSGRRVLLVELGRDSYLGPSFELSDVGFKPRKLVENVDLALWDPESCLRDYVLYLVKVERIYKLFFENKVMRSFIDVAPGLKELSILGKATSQIRGVGPSLQYDDIVFDSFSTGHTLALLKAPKAMVEVVSRGPMGQQAKDIFSVLNNKKHSRFYCVTIPEELPVTESLEFQAEFNNVMESKLEFVLNKELEIQTPASQVRALVESLPRHADYFKYLAHKLETQAKQLCRLSQQSMKSKLSMIWTEPQFSKRIERLSKRVVL